MNRDILDELKTASVLTTFSLLHKEMDMHNDRPQRDGLPKLMMNNREQEATDHP
jgi:hypothetical protein